ncbi:DUF2769 domain-containing protein [Methanosphaerula subterraneus]|uniref:DUF2769 domain-containing protein n=1 Tax=Methanosphaerula subterraneus TaxID=3350244 RepID=UPI003F85BC5A
MDTFSEALPGIEKKIPELKSQCICPDCPTYNDCARNGTELLYCIEGRSSTCITENLGCICPVCPLTSELGLLNLTFCLLGSEQEQRSLKSTGKIQIP